ncbi:hypothetical protein Tco_1276149 [Tanacetum coccineum]
MDSILNLNIESTSLIDVPVTINVEIPPSSTTTLPPPPTPFIQHLQQTPVPTPTIVPSTSQQNLPTFAVSSIPGIIDKYLANQMNEVVKAAIQLQSDRLKEKAQADNQDFINKIDENIKKIIKEQVKVQVKEQSPRFCQELRTANLSELELKKILIDKMENNKSINRLVQQKNLYKALVDAYETDKDILATYAVTFKMHLDDEDEDE